MGIIPSQQALLVTDPVADVGGAKRIDRAGLSQFDPLRVETLKKPDAVAE
jgi:hypothetical protein